MKTQLVVLITIMLIICIFGEIAILKLLTSSYSAINQIIETGQNIMQTADIFRDATVGIIVIIVIILLALAVIELLFFVL